MNRVIGTVEQTVLGGSDSLIYRAVSLAQEATNIAIEVAVRNFRNNNPKGRQAIERGAPIWMTIVWDVGPIDEGGGKGYGYVKTPEVDIYSYPW